MAREPTIRIECYPFEFTEQLGIKKEEEDKKRKTKPHENFHTMESSCELMGSPKEPRIGARYRKGITLARVASGPTRAALRRLQSPPLLTLIRSKPSNKHFVVHAYTLPDVCATAPCGANRTQMSFSLDLTQALHRFKEIADERK